MPGPVCSEVKCEPPSDEEDAEGNFSQDFVEYQLASIELRPLKLEPDCGSQNGEVSAELLDLENLQCQYNRQYNTQGSGLEELAPLAPAAPAATPVCAKQEPACATTAFTLETLVSSPYGTNFSHNGNHMTTLGSELADSGDFAPFMAVKDEPLSEGEQQHLSGDDTSDSCGPHGELFIRSSPKSWTQKDMDNALEALRKHDMSLTKASLRFGIPSTTLWQRAHKLGIGTPKREGAPKGWSPERLAAALAALRQGAISANKASKAYGIPSSTLYKIARREGIRLAAPFNAAPTAWRRADLHLALAAIRRGGCSVQGAATRYGIPTGTLYGRCKREGIELSRSNPTPWSEDAMGEALEAVRVGQMSINQAAIHYNLPYSSLYGRFKRCRYQSQGILQSTEHQIDQKRQEIDHLPTQNFHHSTAQHIPVTEQNGYQYPPREYPLQGIPQDSYHGMYYNHYNGIATS